MLRGQPKSWSSPLELRLHIGGSEQRYRLWVFEVRHGGKSRPEEEYRIQVSNGPKEVLNERGFVDVLLGYSKDLDVLVGYDPRYVEKYLKDYAIREGGSDSAQVSLQTLKDAAKNGVAYEAKDTKIVGPNTRVAAFRPEHLAAFLAQREAFLDGKVAMAQALSAAGGSSFAAYAGARQLHFPPRVVARYVAALTTKPLVILTGVSGTGKTKLAQLSAEFFSRIEAAHWSSAQLGVAAVSPDGAAEYGTVSGVDETRFALVAVRPSWTDGRSLLGYFNPLTGAYEPTQALILLLRARQAAAATPAGAPAPPYFLILDEMNLARVEHYFSDFLSAIETRKQGPAGIEQEAVVLHDQATAPTIQAPKLDGTSETLEVPARLPIPTNVFFTGTVNVDETTHGFSPKVLDRAHVIEFDEVDLAAYRAGIPASPGAAAEPTIGLPERIEPATLATRQDYAKLPLEVHERLLRLNSSLSAARLHLGYRSVNEIAAFYLRYRAMLSGPDAGALDREAFDAAMLQKILPRLSGTRSRLEGPLLALLRELSGATTLPSDADAAFAALRAAVAPGTAPYPASAKRTLEMLETLREFGFVSFFK